MNLIAQVKSISDALINRDVSLLNLKIPSARQSMGFMISILIAYTLASVAGIVATILFLPGIVQSHLAPRSKEFLPPSAMVLKQGASLDEFKFIIKRNLFNSDGQLADTDKENKCNPTKSDLPLKFTGIIYGGSNQASLILLEAESTKEADTFVLGDMVPGDAKIVDIQRNKVFFDRKGCPEFLELIETVLPKRRVAGVRKKVAPVALATNSDDVFKEDGFERSGESIKVTKEWVERALTIDFAKTLQDAKASPNQVGSEVKGFILTRIRPDSVYEKMGLQDGDIVEVINGVEMNDAARAIATLNSLRKEPSIEVQVRRGTQTFSRKVQVK